MSQSQVTQVGKGSDTMRWWPRQVPRAGRCFTPKTCNTVAYNTATCTSNDSRGLRVGVVGLGAVGTILFTQLSRIVLKSSTRPLVQAVEAFVKPHHLTALAQQRRVALSLPQAEKTPFASIALDRGGDREVVGANGSIRIHALDSKGDEAHIPLDVVLVTLKAYDSAQVIEELQHKHARRFRRDALFVLVQNGLGAFPAENPDNTTAYHYANGVTYVGGRVESTGHVVVSGFDTQSTFFAPVDRNCESVVSHRLRVLSDAFVQSGLRSQVLTPPEMQTILWRKLIVNAAINPIAALLDAPNGYVGACEWTRRSVDAVVREAVTVAQCERVDLQATEEELVEYVLNVAVNTSTNVCSTVADLRRGARTEIDAITGALVRCGQKHNVPMPTNQLLLDLVKALETQQLRRRG